MATRPQIEAKLVELGFTKDRFGNYKRPDYLVNKNTGELRVTEKRFKMQERSARYDVKQKDGSWFTKVSSYYCNMEILDKGIKIGHITVLPIEGVKEKAEAKSAELKAANQIYIDKGYKHRLDYLTHLAEDNGIDIDNVIAVANLLGPSEDFDGLLSSIGGM